MDARTRLAFFILKTRTGWIVRADGYVYPPCVDRADALAKAIREAQAAERFGFATVVLAQSATGERCHVRWRCADDCGAVGGARQVVVAMTGMSPSAPRPEDRP